MIIDYDDIFKAKLAESALKVARIDCAFTPNTLKGACLVHRVEFADADRDAAIEALEHRGLYNSTQH